MNSGPPPETLTEDLGLELALQKRPSKRAKLIALVHRLFARK